MKRTNPVTGGRPHRDDELSTDMFEELVRCKKNSSENEYEGVSFSFFFFFSNSRAYVLLILCLQVPFSDDVYPN